jgi:hypothetical protein
MLGGFAGLSTGATLTINPQILAQWNYLLILLLPATRSSWQKRPDLFPK